MPEKKKLSYVGWLLLGALAVLILSIAVLSCVPPVSKDALVHHLAVPKLYLKHGGMYEIPFMPFSYYPMNLDLLYLIPLYFGNDIIPKFIHFSFALLTAWILLSYLRLRIGFVYGLFGAIFFLSIPVIIKLSITVYIDLGIICFSTASLLSILRWVESEFQNKHLISGAVFCGLGLGTKYNGLITLFLLTLLTVFLFARCARREQPGFAKPVWRGLVFFSVSLLVFSPWMIRNYHWKKNPIYPLYNQYFNPVNSVTQDSSSEEERSQGGHGIFAYRKVVYQETGWQMALLPLRIFFEGRDGDPQHFDGKLNPLLLLLPLFAFYRSREDPPVMRREKKVLIAFSTFFFLFAFFSTDLRMRYISPIIPSLVIMSTFGLSNLIRRVKGVRSQQAKRIMAVSLLVILLLSIGMNARYLVGQFQYVNPFSYLRGALNRDEYITLFRPEYPAVQYINHSLAANALISLIFLGNRGYYLERDYIYGEEMLRQIAERALGPEDLRRELRAKGVTHLFIHNYIFTKWINFNLNENERFILNNFVVEYTKNKFNANGYTILSIE